MEIKNSLDFPKVEMAIRANLQKLTNPKYRMDANRLLRNIELMVSELSRLELKMRTSPGHSRRLVDQQLEKINEEINGIEQWVTMLLLTNGQTLL